MKAKGKKVATSGIVILMMAAAMVGYYYYLSNKERIRAEKNPKITAVQEVLMRDLEHDYPQTPKEVIKYYSELTRCFYNDEHSAGEMNALADKARSLYDQELLDNNEWSQYVIKLQGDVDYYRQNEMVVASFNVAASTDVEYYGSGGKDYAKLHCNYVIKQKSGRQELKEVFVLRKDDSGHWKILGWDLAANVDGTTTDTTMDVLSSMTGDIK